MKNHTTPTPSALRQQQLEAFNSLLDILDKLRAECPWDKKQTLESLRHLTIEETYELTDAILKQESEEIKKELGDILLHMVFYARIGWEQDQFNLADVLNAQCEKLIYRHPHIFGDSTAATEEEVKQNWEQLKLKEKGNRGVLAGVSSGLPALVKAMRIQEKARGAGFDWEHKHQVWEKVQEELEEFKQEFDVYSNEQTNKTRAESEFGDLLFSLINFSRFIDINAEEALEKTNLKFIKRFTYLETEATKDGKQLKDLTLSEMDVYWNRAKNL